MKLTIQNTLQEFNVTNRKKDDLIRQIKEILFQSLPPTLCTDKEGMIIVHEDEILIDWDTFYSLDDVSLHELVELAKVLDVPLQNVCLNGESEWIIIKLQGNGNDKQNQNRN